MDERTEQPRDLKGRMREHVLRVAGGAAPARCREGLIEETNELIAISTPSVKAGGRRQGTQGLSP